jgi:hypothetical protein
MKRHYKKFQDRFIGKIRSGVKTSTIRPLPKRAQDMIYCWDMVVIQRWSGKAYRSKVETIGTVQVKGVQTIVCTTPLDKDFVFLGMCDDNWKTEGFESTQDMIDWFSKTHGSKSGEVVSFLFIRWGQSFKPTNGGEA